MLLDCLPPGVTATAVRCAVVLNMVCSIPVSLYPATEMLERRAEWTLELGAADVAELDALDEQLFTEWEEWGNLDPTQLP